MWPRSHWQRVEEPDPGQQSGQVVLATQRQCPPHPVTAFCSCSGSTRDRGPPAPPLSVQLAGGEGREPSDLGQTRRSVSFSFSLHLILSLCHFLFLSFSLDHSLQPSPSSLNVYLVLEALCGAEVLQRGLKRSLHPLILHRFSESEGVTI